MDTKKVTIGVFVATTLVFGVLAFKAPAVIQTETLGSQSQVVVPAPVVNVEASQPVVIPAPVVNVNVPRQETRLGSVSSPDIQSPYFSVGGLSIWAQRTTNLTQASTTVCSIQSPAATSSLLFAGIEFDVASTSATYVELARATTPYATTTRIGSVYTIGANKQANIVASTTGSVAGDATIFPPNTYFNVNTSWATAATALTVPRGSCQVMWAAM